MEKSKQVIFLLGGPGSGKGTHGAILAKKHHALHISAGDCLREESQREDGKYTEMIRTYIANGQILPATITVKLLLQKMDAHQDYNIFLIDGFPRTHENYQVWYELVSEERYRTKCLFLNCTEEIMEKRLLSRGQSSGRVDDKAEVIKKRFDVFVSSTLPVIDEFRKRRVLYEFDSTMPIEDFWAAYESSIARMVRE